VNRGSAQADVQKQDGTIGERNSYGGDAPRSLGRPTRLVESGLADALTLGGRAAAGELEPAPVLAQLAALLEAVHHAVQAGRVNAELLARVADRDARTAAHELNQLFAALTRTRAAA